MILKASQRGGGSQLGIHLLKAENEHVEVHEIRGFVADDVKGAMKEAQAVARGTRCKQYLFSVSLNPPETAAVSKVSFESALDRIEKATGLTGQPRIVVFHEKEGRRHAHCVWSRINAETMTAVPLPFFKAKLREVSKGLYLEHGWQMPRGLMDSKERNPSNFSLDEWQQAKRMGRDPKQLKETIQECWAVSGSREQFAKALEERGLHLAKGDRRAHVAVTCEGEAVSVARMVGKKAKEVTAKLGKADDLKSVADTREHIATKIRPRLEGLIKEADRARTREMEPLEKRRLDMKALHTKERERMADGQKARSSAEGRARADRFRTGMVGLCDRFTGKNSAIRQQNERETFNSYRRDQTQRDGLVADQLRERRGLQSEIRDVRTRHAKQVLGLHRDLAQQGADKQKEGASEKLTETFGRSALSTSRGASPRGIVRGNTQGRNGPSLGR